MIICIGREFGSGGHEIGKRMAEKTGFTLYDKQLIEEAAKHMKEMPLETIERADEKKHNPWLHRIWYDAEDKELRGLSANDMMFRVQSRIITDLARKGDCIFIGRCADYILSNAGIERISLFVAAPFEDRVKRKTELLGISEKNAIALVRKTDKVRKSYYDYYTGGNWGKPCNYDFCINSSRLGIEESARCLVKMLPEN